MRYVSLAVLMVLGPFVQCAYECGNIRFSSDNVHEHDTVDLIYSYTNRYLPRKWYKYKDSKWTKLYDSSLSWPSYLNYSERYQDNTYILTLPSVTTDDSGTYVVVCATDTNKQSAPVELKVIPQSLGQGLCGRLEILSLSFAVGSSVQFKFTANSPQSKIHWQFEDKGTFITLGLEARVRLTNNRARTVFGRKLNILSGDMGTYRVQCSDGGVSNIVVLAVDIIPPGKPVIANAKTYHGCRNCLLAVPDKRLNISCFSYNGSAPVDLKLYFNDIKINSAVSQDVTRDRIAVEKLRLIEKTDESGVIKCTAKNAAVDLPIETTAGLYFFRGRWFEPKDRPIFFPRTNDSHWDRIHSSLTAVHCFDDGYMGKQPVAWKEFCAGKWLKELQENMDRCIGQREPANPVIQTRDCIEGKTAAITCVSTGGKPAPIIRFEYDQSKIQPKAQVTINAEDGSARVASIFYANLTRKDNLKTIQCRSEILHSKKRTEETLKVKFPPIKLDITKVTEVFTPEGDTNLTLRCHIGESNPKSTAIWQGLETIIRAPADDKNTAEVGNNGGLNFQHDLPLTLSKEDNMKEIKCIALNGDFPDLDLQKSFRISIPYQPIIRIAGGSDITTHEGSDVTITCDVDSNPSSTISWSQNDKLLRHADKVENGKFSLNLQNMSLSNDSTVFTCAAQNGVGVLVTRNVTLFVKEKKLAVRRVLPSEGNERTIVGVLCGTIFTIVIGVVVVIVFTRRRRLLKSGRQSSVRIQIENRQPSIHPPADEPVYNNIVLQPEVTNGIENAEYAKVIPRSQRNVTNAESDNQDNAEYAVVIPKSQREPKQQDAINENEEHAANTCKLVYAELELHAPVVDDAANNRFSPRQQQPATEYVSIDFTRSKEFNAQQNGHVDADI